MVEKSKSFEIFRTSAKKNLLFVNPYYVKSFSVLLPTSSQKHNKHNIPRNDIQYRWELIEAHIAVETCHDTALNDTALISDGVKLQAFD